MYTNSVGSQLSDICFIKTTRTQYKLVTKRWYWQRSNSICWTQKPQAVAISHAVFIV